MPLMTEIYIKKGSIYWWGIWEMEGEKGKKQTGNYCDSF